MCYFRPGNPPCTGIVPVTFPMKPQISLQRKRGPARDRRGWLEREAYELSKHCPIDHSNPADCPLCGLRPLPATARRAWIHRLTDEELEYLVTYHTCCCAVKTAPAEA